MLVARRFRGYFYIILQKIIGGKIPNYLKKLIYIIIVIQIKTYTIHVRLSLSLLSLSECR